jgi:hypothetical protein
MNALAANDIEATDLPARLDDDGPSWSTLAGPVPDMIATAQEPAGRR